MKIFLRKNSIKFIIIIISLFIFLLFGFAIYIDSCLKRAYSIGEFTLKIEAINQKNHLVTPEVIDRGLKKALLSCQLEPKHWGVDQVYKENFFPGFIIQNWREEQQLTNNTYFLVLTNTVLKGGRELFVNGKRNMIYCRIRFLADHHALT